MNIFKHFDGKIERENVSLYDMEHIRWVRNKVCSRGADWIFVR